MPWGGGVRAPPRGVGHSGQYVALGAAVGIPTEVLVVALWTLDFPCGFLNFNVLAHQGHTVDTINSFAGTLPCRHIHKLPIYVLTWLGVICWLTASKEWCCLLFDPATTVQKAELAAQEDPGKELLHRKHPKQLTKKGPQLGQGYIHTERERERYIYIYL